MHTDPSMSSAENTYKQLIEAYHKAGMQPPPYLEAAFDWMKDNVDRTKGSLPPQGQPRRDGDGQQEAMSEQNLEQSRGHGNTKDRQGDVPQSKTGSAEESSEQRQQQNQAEQEQKKEPKKRGRRDGSGRSRKKSDSQSQFQPQHPRMESLQALVAADIPVMLVGPAGSGKTTACSIVAERLNLPFYAQSFCSQTSLSTLIGYKDAVGTYHPSVFRLAFEHGGIYLMDEIDAGNPNITAFLNAALSNGLCSFPDGMIKKHHSFRVIAAANTWGGGKTVEYIGRNPIDAATLDRFAQLDWPYDNNFEAMITPNALWLAVVRGFREAVLERGVKAIISPRASIYGSRLLESGMNLDAVIKVTLIKGLDEGTAKAILKMPAVDAAINALKGHIKAEKEAEREARRKSKKPIESSEPGPEDHMEQVMTYELADNHEVVPEMGFSNA